jgi:serine protease AprX
MILLTAGSPVAASKPTSLYIIQANTSAEAARLAGQYGGRVTSHLEIIDAVAAQMPEKSVELARMDARIDAIWTDSAVQTADTEPHDPVPTTDYPDVVGADVAWGEGALGEDVSVAIVDTGLSQHPGLEKKIQGQGGNRIIGWIDFVDGKRAPHDPNGHGTHIAGIIGNAQVGSDGEWNGIAPGVRLVGVRVLDEEGSGTYSQVIQGIEWVIDHKDELNIRVLNLSLVSNVQSPYWADPLNQAVMEAWADGITVVVAAGNDGPQAMSISVPGNNPYVITVGAFTDNYTPNNWGDDYLTPFSAAGPTLDGFAKPDVVAPGAHMASSMPGKGYIAEHHQASRLSQKYFSMAGTSQAAAVVSGVAALTLSHNPDLSPDQVKYRITQTAFPWVDLTTTDSSSAEAIYSLWQQGAGRVNARDAVFSDAEGYSNFGLDIQADIDGLAHYQGF